MELNHCSFPDDLLYDLENNTWVKTRQGGEATVGVNTLLSAIAGKLTHASLRSVGTIVEKGRSLGTLESMKFVGPVPSPISGVITRTNDAVVKKPKLVNDSPYQEGWLVTLKPSHLDCEILLLSKAQDSRLALELRVGELRARCFKAYPDHEMFEIGNECSAVLVRLNELIAAIPVGDVIHIVSDDPTAYVEMVRWQDQTGHVLVDWRAEGNLFHFIVRKAS